MSTTKLPFLAVGRVMDAVTLASCSDKLLGQSARDVFNKLLAAASHKLSAGQRTRLAWNEGSVCCLMDSEGTNLYCVVTAALSYPEKLAYQLLYDLIAVVEKEGDVTNLPEYGLNRQLQGEMIEMVRKYEDVTNFQQFGVQRASLSQTFATEPGAEDAPGPSKLPIIIVAFLVVAVILGAVYWFFFRGEANDMQVAFARDATPAALAGVPGVSPTRATITMI